MVSKHHTTGRNNPEDHFSFDRSQNLNSGTKSRASEFRMRNTDCWWFTYVLPKFPTGTISSQDVCSQILLDSHASSGIHTPNSAASVFVEWRSLDVLVRRVITMGATSELHVARQQCGPHVGHQTIWQVSTLGSVITRHCCVQIKLWHLRFPKSNNNKGCPLASFVLRSPLHININRWRFLFNKNTFPLCYHLRLGRLSRTPRPSSPSESAARFLVQNNCRG